MDLSPKYNPYLDPNNKKHRDYTRLDVSQSPDSVPDTPFNSPTAMTLSNTESSNPSSLNQLIMDGSKSSSSPSSSHRQSQKATPTSAPSDWRPTPRNRAVSSGSGGSDITSASRGCYCGGGGMHRRQSDDEPSSGLGAYRASRCEQRILRDEGVERGRCRTRTNSSTSRDKTSCSREKRRGLNI
ncbi:hypothetical protein DSL72_003824 [Monilinia vaccinii-corymbosi]|uniref:Uncharacterized protein n=1 Tax=Monilinia vaccinii-corymbosi TaxID=61207 RepID=A0A8A3P3A3_9HELO|nr:hypothetical protein DSL72_003824 [Monilinia vaccinii-corymbosi]